ncbi:MAG TPA: MarR family winged helix-turn-helix transcriptional regulator [Ktedonobacterales bacterium]
MGQTGIDFAATQRCACANIRRTERVITQLYDELLAPSGLSAPQFGLLATLSEVAPITINALAEKLTMDRTTLTRNLSLLAKQGMVRIEEGEDRRTRVVVVTSRGDESLARAWPLWQDAQARVEGVLGRARFDALLAELAAVRTSAR